jgi:hypothetical protein
MVGVHAGTADYDVAISTIYSASLPGGQESSPVILTSRA